MKVNVVAIVFLHRTNALLLLKRYDTGNEDGKYGLPGGHLEDGESVRHAAVRECRKEIGIDLVESDFCCRGHVLPLRF